MTKYTDIANSFDAAFYKVRGEHPDPNKKMGDDYNMSQPNVLSVLSYSGAFLSAKGWLLQSGIDPSKCLTETIAAVLQDINAKTIRKPIAKPLSKKKRKRPTRAS